MQNSNLLTADWKQLPEEIVRSEIIPYLGYKRFLFQQFDQGTLFYSMRIIIFTLREMPKRYISIGLLRRNHKIDLRFMRIYHDDLIFAEATNSGFSNKVYGSYNALALKMMGLINWLEGDALWNIREEHVINILKVIYKLEILKKFE